MIRKCFSATLSAALCMMAVLPGVAAAQEHRFTGFDAPRGATATVNLRVPFGPQARNRASYGMTLSYGQPVGAGVDGREATRAFNFADFRFAGTELRNARVASFDLANLDQDRRMNLTGAGKKTWLILGIIVAGVVICIAADCFDGDDEDESPGT